MRAHAIDYRLTTVLATVLVVWMPAPAEAETVLTATQATYSLTRELTEGTSISVANVPEDGREMALLPDYIERRMDRLTPLFAAATAVVSLTNALPGDPIYRFARDANIRIVDIDASIPFSLSMPGVALTETPASNVPWGEDTDAVQSETAPYFWLSVSNAIRMTDIIAHDLSAIFVDEAATISSNLERTKQSLLELRREYQDRLIAAPDDIVFALTSDFVYLTNDMGIYVDGYFVKQDIRWTEQDLAMLTRHLAERDIHVVIHKWMPSEEIQAAVAAANAEIVVLESGDSGVLVNDALAPDGLELILHNNLEAIASALERRSR